MNIGRSLLRSDSFLPFLPCHKRLRARRFASIFKSISPFVFERCPFEDHPQDIFRGPDEYKMRIFSIKLPINVIFRRRSFFSTLRKLAQSFVFPSLSLESFLEQCDRFPKRKKDSSPLQETFRNGKM